MMRFPGFRHQRRELPREPIGHLVTGTVGDIGDWRPGYLRCGECEAYFSRERARADAAVLAAHWEADHPRKWEAMRSGRAREEP